MDVFYVTLLVISIVWSVLGIILFFKIWNMTSDVRKIKDMLASSARSASPQPTPHNNPSTLTKGNRYIVEGFGVCKYDGIYSGCHYFYPEKHSDLPESQFLVSGAEPYLAIPPRSLSQFTITAF